nr:LacI family DNA-binding transcriptional regulator [uncultured Cohaesibacter sp.]
MVSIKDIAADVGVTAATVSNALNGKGRVSEQLVERIKARAEELGYRPSSAAIALKSGRSNILGLVMPDLINPLFPHLAQSLSMAADERNLAILIADSRRSATEQQQAIRRLASRGIDGLIIVPQRGTTPVPVPVPVAIINAASDQHNTVSSDHRGGGVLIAQHIHGLGHRHVIILGEDPISEVQQDRVAGMISMLEGRVKLSVQWGDKGLASLSEELQAGATAILTTSDMLALKVRSLLMEIGKNVPEDVSLTGFDDTSFGQLMYPPLTTVAQNTQSIAEKAIAFLVGQIEAKISEKCKLASANRDMQQNPQQPQSGQTVPMRLVARDSTSSPKDPSQQET